MNKKITKEEALCGLKKYFNDSLQASTFLKYVLQDKHDNYYEDDPNQTFERISKELARVELKWPNPMKAEEIFFYLKDFKKIVFQGSPMAGIGNDFIYSSLSNCIVLNSPEDTMSSILNRARDMANLYKRRCGVGMDLSSLRPEGTSVNNSAKTSTGAWSFAELYSDVSKKIGQNGRRAALMLTMDIRHPDVLKLIKAKTVEGKIDRANISIKVTDDFFIAVEENSMFVQQWPIDSDSPKITKEIDASEFMDVISEYAAKTGDPGLLLFDNICNNLPAHLYERFKTISTNPCGELPLSKEDSCRLLSQTLPSYVINPFTENAEFDLDDLYKDTMVAQRFADDLVELEIEKLRSIITVADTEDEKILINKLIESCESGRRTGVGTHGLADVFIMMGMTYGDERSIKLTEEIYKTRMNASYYASSMLAKERGCFPEFNLELESGHLFLERLDNKVKKVIKKYGRRNVSNLTNAPTGSIAIVSGTSAGIDPNFSIRKFFRKKRKNHNDKFDESDFTDKTGEHWEVFEVVTPIVKRWIQCCGAAEEIPDYFIKASDVDIDGRLMVQSVAQKYIDHSISNTFNLPADTTGEKVREIYMKSWKYGVKGVTVFVDGCKDAVLNKENPLKFQMQKAIKRPLVLNCEIHNVTVKKEKWTIIVGLLNDEPYEIFGGLSKNIELPKKIIKGKVHKVHYRTKPSIYNLELDNELIIKDINNIFNNDLYGVHTRMVSLALRHNAKPSFIAEQLQKDKSDNDLTSFSNVLARVLKKYISNGTKVTSEKYCTGCDSGPLVYQDGCIICMFCGYSKCN